MTCFWPLIRGGMRKQPTTISLLRRWHWYWTKCHVFCIFPLRTVSWAPVGYPTCNKSRYKHIDLLFSYFDIFILRHARIMEGRLSSKYIWIACTSKHQMYVQWGHMLMWVYFPILLLHSQESESPWYQFFRWF